MLVLVWLNGILEVFLLNHVGKIGVIYPRPGNCLWSALSVAAGNVSCSCLRRLFRDFCSSDILDLGQRETSYKSVNVKLGFIRRRF